MKAVPYLFIALAIAILTGSVLMLGGAYFELVHPTVVRKGQFEMEPANACWFIGSILDFVASAILLGMIQLLRERRSSSKEMHARTPHPFGQYRMISLIHLLSIKARPLLPLSQEQGSIDTETVAATRFAAPLLVYSRVNPKIN